MEALFCLINPSAEQVSHRWLKPSSCGFNIVSIYGRKPSYSWSMNSAVISSAVTWCCNYQVLLRPLYEGGDQSGLQIVTMADLRYFFCLWAASPSDSHTNSGETRASHRILPRRQLSFRRNLSIHCDGQSVKHRSSSQTSNSEQIMQYMYTDLRMPTLMYRNKNSMRADHMPIPCSLILNISMEHWMSTFYVETSPFGRVLPQLSICSWVRDSLFSDFWYSLNKRYCKCRRLIL